MAGNCYFQKENNLYQIDVDNTEFWNVIEGFEGYEGVVEMKPINKNWTTLPMF